MGLNRVNGKIVDELCKVVCGETMAWKRGVITWIQPQFCHLGVMTGD